MCDNYCSVCRQSHCPCSDLPPDDGDEPCFTTAMPELPAPRTSGAAATRWLGEGAATVVLIALSVSVAAHALV